MPSLGRANTPAVDPSMDINDRPAGVAVRALAWLGPEKAEAPWRTSNENCRLRRSASLLLQHPSFRLG